MHTDNTLLIFDKTTVDLGAESRKFAKKTCSAFDTRELKREAELHKRRQQKQKQKRGHMESEDMASNPMGASSAKEHASSGGPQRKKFSLQTFKYHSLGDYAATIHKFGTSDSYSTEPVSTYQFLCSRVIDTWSHAG
jgi:hypothetical protein